MYACEYCKSFAFGENFDEKYRSAATLISNHNSKKLLPQKIHFKTQVYIKLLPQKIHFRAQVHIKLLPQKIHFKTL